MTQNNILGAAGILSGAGRPLPAQPVRGTPPSDPPPPPPPGGGGGGGNFVSGKMALGSYSDIYQLDGWLNRQLACKSFYCGLGDSYTYGWAPTSTSHDSSWQTRKYIMTNAPGAGADLSPTERNRRLADGTYDSYVRACADALAGVFSRTSNYTHVILVVNEFQCWWNGGDGGYDVEAWKAAVRRSYSTMKQVLGDKLIWVLAPSHNWPPNLINGGTRNCPVRWLDWYPGDQYCDAVGMTLYSTWRPNAPGFNLYGNTWQDQLLDPRNDWGPEAMFNFAVQRGKWFFISEYGPMWDQSQWGYTPPSWYDAEQADFFQFSFDRWLSKPQCLGTIFFNDWTHDGYHKMDNLPQARAKFIQLWS